MSAADSDVIDVSEEKPQLVVDVKVDVLSPCERHVVVTIPHSEVERYRQVCFDEIVPKASMPGFRAGKAPRKLVESRFKEQVADQVKSNLVMDSLQKVTDGGHFFAIGEPNLDYDAITLPEDRDFVYEYRIEVRPDFDTPKWEGLSLERPVLKISDKHVDEHLMRTLDQFVAGEATDSPCQAGDSVTLDGSFEYEGREIARFEEEKITVRSKLSFGDAVIDGFDKLIAGKVEGDVFSTTVTLSDSAADEELQGKEVTATFEIVEIRRIEVGELSDATLGSLGFDSSDELREFVQSELTKQFKYHQEQSLRKQIVKTLTAGANWEMPESLVRSQTNRELQRLVLELQRSGLNQNEIKRYLNASRMNARESTIAALREHFVLEKIAEDLKVEPTPEDYDREIELIAEQNNSTSRRIRARLEKTGQMDALRNQIVERLVIDRIVEAAKVKDVPGDSFLAAKNENSDIDFTIAGNYVDIPDAKHDNAPPELPGAAKLPDSEDSKRN